MKAYLAGSIFYLGDKFRNEYFCKKLREAFPNLQVYNPLENTEINDKTKFADARAIADGLMVSKVKRNSRAARKLQMAITFVWIIQTY